MSYRFAISWVVCLGVVWVFWAGHTQAVAQQTAIPLSSATERVAVTAFAAFFADSTGRLTIEDVRQRPFAVPSDGHFLLTEAPATHWLRLEVVNTMSLPATWMLTVRARGLHHVQFYRTARDSSIVGEVMGLGVRDSLGTRHVRPTFGVALTPDDTTRFYLRLETARATSVALTMTPAAVHEATYKNRRYRLGLFLGITLGLFFYNLFLYLSVRLRDYLYYILYLGSSILYVALYDGVLYELTMLPFSPIWTEVLPVFLILNITFWMVQFARHFLRLAQRAPRWDAAIRYVLYGLVLCIPLSIFPIFEDILYVVGLVFGGIILGLSVQAIRASFRPARFFVASFLAFMLGHSFELFGFYGLISFDFSGPGLLAFTLRYVFSFYGGVTMEMILLSLALADLINESRREKEIAQAEALRHEQASNRLKDQYTARLQDEVTLKTAEIAEQNQRLAEQAKRLKELDAAKSRFFANVSHELRTPLTLTIGPLEDLIAGKRGSLSSTVQADVDLALRNSRRQLRLVNQILDVAKLEAGEMYMKAAQHDLNAFVERLTLAFAPFSDRKRITFTFAPSAASLLVYFDSDQFEKVLTNLLSNAFKFTPEGGAIYCGVREDPPDESAPLGWATVEIRDTGPGISPEQQAHIFERFYQTDESMRNRQIGTGIGLALVKELVDLHQGRITVESQPGFGATFTVSLRQGHDHLHDGIASVLEPFERSVISGFVLESSPVRDPRPASLEAIDEDQTTVLVVDDNADIRAFVRRHLEPTYRVVEAENGQDGLVITQKLLPDLVLSDVMMPELDGYGLCRALKADPDFAFIPIILLTARAEQTDKIAGLQEGADDYITKPFHADELLARIDNLIASRKRLWERVEQVSLQKTAAMPPSSVPITSADEAFLAQLQAVLDTHLSDSTFDVNRLATEVGLSRTSLYRRLDALLSVSPNALLLQARLERAAQLLAADAGLVSEVTYAVGFKSVTHFSRRFREHFGVAPSRYRTSIDAQKG